MNYSIVVKLSTVFFVFLFIFFNSVEAADPQIDLTIDGQNSPVVLSSPATYSVEWAVSNDPDSCIASGGWSGSKSILGGNDVLNNLIGNYQYELECLGGTSLPEGHMDVIGGTIAPADSLPGISSTVSIYDVAVKGDYAFALVYDYITCDGGCGGGSVDDWDELVVYDVSDPTSPQIVGRTFTGISPHTIVINGDYAYVGVSYGISAVGSTLEVYDISDPTSPTFLRGRSFDGGGRIQELVLEGDSLYAFGGNIYSELVVYDVSSPAYPGYKGSYDNGGTYFSAGAVRGDYVYVADYANSSLVTLDTSDLSYSVGFNSNVKSLTNFFVKTAHASGDIIMVDSDPRSSASLYTQMVIVGDYLYAPTAFANDASPALLEIFSIADSANPVLVGAFDLLLRPPFGTWMHSIEVSTDNPDRLYLGTIYGIVTVDISNPTSPVLLGTSPINFAGTNIYGMDFYDKYIVSASNVSGGDNLEIFTAKSSSTIMLTVDSAPPPPPASVTLTANGCLIPDGDSACDISIDWDGENTTAPYSLDRFGITIDNPITEDGNYIDGGMIPGSYTYTFDDDSGQIGLDTATAACNVGSSADETGIGICVPTPATPTITIEADPEFVRRGNTVELTTTIDSPYLLNCTLSNAIVGSAIDFTHDGTITQLDDYRHTTDPIFSRKTFQVSCVVDGFSAVVGVGEVSVEVVPSIDEI